MNYVCILLHLSDSNVSQIVATKMSHTLEWTKLKAKV